MIGLDTREGERSLMQTGFGWIEVGKKTYPHDIIIHTDGSVSKRKKKVSKGMKGDYGHTPLSEFELGCLSDEKPEVVYIGTGQFGSLPLTPEAEEILSSFITVLLPTSEIIRVIEDEKRSFVALL
ncbi:MAG TPA: hypothetical protein PKG69_05980, partial [Methanoregulaceae archaeon]|nr:hypothetical protein [Methanoregulaceae archaeon]